MKTRLLDYVQCPICHEPLHVADPRSFVDEDELERGTLACTADHRFSVDDGIPNLVTDHSAKVERTAKQFAYEFMDVGQVADPEKKRAEDVTLFFAKTGIDPDFYQTPGLDFRIQQDHRQLGYESDYGALAGKLVVDAGSADGRLAQLVAPHAGEMILLDLGEHIGEARRRLGHLDHVHFVRCNLVRSPLRHGVADFIYSIGVLHHTPSLPDALAGLGRALSSGGELAVWVYPHAYWGNPIKKWIALRIRHYLLRQRLDRQLRFIKRYLMPLGRLQMTVARRRWLKYLLAPLFLVNVPRHEDRNEMLATVVDYYLPEYIDTYSDKDLEDHFRAAGLTYRALPFPTSGRGGRRAG